MLQDIPLHVTMMTYLLIALDRYRLVSAPGKPRIPAFVCALGTWFFAVCIVLPYAIYTTYLDLEVIPFTFESLGCWINVITFGQNYTVSFYICQIYFRLDSSDFLQFYLNAMKMMRKSESQKLNLEFFNHFFKLSSEFQKTSLSRIRNLRG